jgi:hypothetical protein
LRAKASRLVNVGMLNSTMEKYKPGGHDLRLGIYYKRDDKRLREENIATEVLTRIAQLYPIYAYISWSPKNDYRTQAAPARATKKRSG